MEIGTGFGTPRYKLKTKRGAKAAFQQMYESSGKRGPQIPQLADFINEWFTECRAMVEKGWSSTDTKIPGTRMRRPGLGRTGRRIRVHRGKDLIYDHDNSETYRNVSEVVSWVAEKVGFKDYREYERIPGF